MGRQTRKKRRQRALKDFDQECKRDEKKVEWAILCVLVCLRDPRVGIKAYFRMLRHPFLFIKSWIGLTPERRNNRIKTGTI